nr:MAG TPA: hypothetical protein [Caudoviricetes sp.]
MNTTDMCPKYNRPKDMVCPLKTHLNRDCIECELPRKEINHDESRNA